MGQIAVTDLTTAYATLGLGFAGREGREVIVEQEAFATLVDDIVDNLLVKLCAESDCRERLGLATGEYCRSVGAGDIIDFTPDGTNFSGLASVKAYALVKDAAAHGLFLHVMVVTLDERCLFVTLFFGKRFNIFVTDGIEAVLTPVLVGATGLGYCICLVIALVVDVLAEVFVVDFVAVFALGERAYFLGQFHLGLALHLDGFVSGLESFKQLGLGYLVHLALDHHDVVIGGTNHQLDVGAFYFVKCRVNDEFAVNASYAHFADRAVEGDVAHCESSRCGKTGECVGHVFAVGGV